MTPQCRLTSASMPAPLAGRGGVLIRLREDPRRTELLSFTDGPPARCRSTPRRRQSAAVDGRRGAHREAAENSSRTVPPNSSAITRCTSPGRRDPVHGDVLRRWLEHHLLAAFATRILPVDLAVVRRAAAMHLPDPRPERDVLIAATALTYNLVVVTRNVADYQPLGVDLVNPWHQ